MNDQPVVAFLGIGIMGRAMAARLLDAGFPVRVWNRTRASAEPLRAHGAVVADSPSEAVAGAEIVITILTDADATLAVMSGEDGEGGALAAMGEGAIWLQMGTVGVAGCDRLAAAAWKHDVPFVDSPVLGTRKPAEDGTLKILAAGPAELRQRCEPVFAPIGTLFRWLGAAGQASRLKLVANAWILCLTDGLATSISLAEHLGLDPQLFLDVTAGSATDNPYLHAKGGAILRGDYTASFTVAGAAKDAGLIVAAGRDAGYDASLIEAARQHLQRAIERGHGNDDMAGVYFGHEKSAEGSAD